MFIRSLNLHNPVFQAELVYQGRDKPRHRRWLTWLIRLTTYLSFLVAFLLAGREFLAALLRFDPRKSVGLAAGILPISTAVGLHFGLMFQTLARSANSVARERESNNWDTLILTGIDAKSIVRGKWAATIQQLWPAYTQLAILRTLIILWFGAHTSRAIFYRPVLGLGLNPAVEIPSVIYFGLAAVFVFAVTMANMAFTAASGVAATIGQRRPSAAMSLVRAVALRLLVIFVVILMSLPAILGSLVLSRAEWPRQLVSAVIVTFVDNGISLGSNLVSWRPSFVDNPTLYLSFAAVASLLIYLLLTYILLRVAQWQAVRQNALPPLRPEHRD